MKAPEHGWKALHWPAFANANQFQKAQGLIQKGIDEGAIAAGEFRIWSGQPRLYVKTTVLR